MDTWNTTRERTYFESYSYTSSSSRSEVGASAGIWTKTMYVSTGYTKEVISDVTYEQAETGLLSGWTATSTVLDNASAGGTTNLASGYSSSTYYASWSSMNIGLTTDESFFTSTEWTLPNLTLQTTTTSTQTAYALTTTEFSYRSFAYTSAGSESTLATTETTVTLTGASVTAQYIEDFGGGFTFESTYEYPATISTTRTITTSTTYTAAQTGPIEYGTVASGRRLWSFSHTGDLTEDIFDRSAYFLTSVADSYTFSTLWNSAQTSEVSFVSLTTSTTYTFSTDSSTSEHSFNSYSTASVGTTYTTGSLLPRGTVSGGGNRPVLSSYTISEHTDSHTQTGTNSETYSTTGYTEIFTTALSTQIVGTGMDMSTYQITAPKLAFSSFSTTAFTSDVFLPLSNINSTFTTAFGTINVNNNTVAGWSQGKSSTRVAFLGVRGEPVFTTAASYFAPIGKVGAMASPFSTSTAGTNITISPAIYYPFMSSIRRNVVVPVTYKNTSATQTGSITWRYKWEDSVLSFTKKDSAGSTTTGSGIPAVVGDAAGEYWTNSVGAVFGGFSPITSAGELGLFQRGAYVVTTYDTAGNSGTAKTVRQEFETSTLMETARLEKNAAAFSTFTFTQLYPIDATIVEQ